MVLICPPAMCYWNAFSLCGDAIWFLILLWLQLNLYGIWPQGSSVVRSHVKSLFLNLNMFRSAFLTSWAPSLLFTWCTKTWWLVSWCFWLNLLLPLLSGFFSCPWWSWLIFLHSEPTPSDLPSTGDPVLEGNPSGSASRAEGLQSLSPSKGLLTSPTVRQGKTPVAFLKKGQPWSIPSSPGYSW